MAQLVKNPPAMREAWVRSPGWEDPLEKGMTTHSSILAWRIPWTSPWGRKESDTTEQLSLSLSFCSSTRFFTVGIQTSLLENEDTLFHRQRKTLLDYLFSCLNFFADLPF